MVPSKTIPQGVTAMLNFDPEGEVEANLEAMTAAMENVTTVQLTYAARDSDFDGHNIKAGEILALDNGKLSFVEKDLQKALLRLTKRMLKSDSSFVTVIYGNNVSEQQADDALKALEDKFGNHVQISMVNGGQPVYYYIISVE